MPLNITIIGLDTVGGSLGLGLGTLDQEALPGGRPVITGWDADKRTLRDARNRLMIDHDTGDIADAVRNADIVFVSGGPTQLATAFSGIAPHVRHGAIVSDVASAKVAALALAKQHLPTTVDFVGGHPLVDPTATDASLDLFKNTIYCLVSGLHTRPDSLDLIASLVMAMGAKPYYIDAAEHDAYVAGIEQLPTIASVALMETISRSGGWREMKPIAAAPFQTATKLAMSDPTINTALAQSNREAIERWLNDYVRVLLEIRDNLHDADQLTTIFEHARDAHESWQDAQPNIRPGENDFYGQNETIDRSISSLFFGRRKKRPDRGR